MIVVPVLIVVGIGWYLPTLWAVHWYGRWWHGSVYIFPCTKGNCELLFEFASFLYVYNFWWFTCNLQLKTHTVVVLIVRLIFAQSPSLQKYCVLIWFYRSRIRTFALSQLWMQMQFFALVALHAFYVSFIAYNSRYWIAALESHRQRQHLCLRSLLMNRERMGFRRVIFPSWRQWFKLLSVLWWCWMVNRKSSSM